MAAPKLDISAISDALARFSPGIARMVTGRGLGLMSPFNGHLKARLLTWEQDRCVFELKNKRRVRNHLGGVHAGALVTLGESAAGLLLLKNFSFSDYRLILKELKAEYERQGRGRLEATAEFTAARRKKVASALEEDAQFVPMVTEIYREDGELVARIKTKWQLKRWEQVGQRRAE